MLSFVIVWASSPFFWLRLQFWLLSWQGWVFLFSSYLNKSTYTIVHRCNLLPLMQLSGVPEGAPGRSAGVVGADGGGPHILPEVGNDWFCLSHQLLGQKYLHHCA